MFQIAVLVAEHFLLPALFVFWLWKRQYPTLVDWLAMVGLVGGYIARLYFTGEWHWFGVYFREVWVVLWIIATGRSLFRLRRVPLWQKHTPKEYLGLIFSGFFAVLFGLLAVWADYGHAYHSGEPLRLHFPLKGHGYHIIHGGDSPLINQHHRLRSPLRYSIDIVKLYPGGTRANGLAPDALSEYAIMGDTVYSPCAGVVATAVDSLPDHPPFEIDTAAARVAGNHLVLRCEESYVVLAHLQRGSLRVQPGDTVTVGQPLAQVGNSGFSAEPHLHIHACKGSGNPILEGEPQPILFEGRFLVRNDRW